MYYRRYLTLLVAVLCLLLGARTDSLAAHQAIPTQPVIESRASSAFIATNTVHTSRPITRTGSIHGRVVLYGPATRQATFVLALRGTQIARQARIGPRGEYILRELAPGNYMLRVVDQQQHPLAPAGDTQVQLAPGETRQLTLDVEPATHGVAPPAVLAPASVSPAAAACTPDSSSASISGTVRAPNGSPIPGVAVTLYTSGRYRLKTNITDSAGAYALTNLAAGYYLIHFDRQTTTTAYKGEWYDNQADQASATPIIVAEGATVSGIDATLEPGAQIRGRVKASDTGGPLPRTDVTIYDSDENQVASATTDATGVYTTTGLPSGSYTVFFKALAPVYVSEYYNNQPDRASATSVVASAPNLRGGIDAVLTRGAQITGRVTAADTGLGLPDVNVDITSSTGENLGYVGYTDSGGYYTTTLGLASGSYRLHFTPHYLSGYTEAERSATVSAPDLLSGADIALTHGGQISGHVTDSTAAPLKSIYVQAFDEATDFRIGATTDAAGNYTIIGLPSGNYIVSFSPPLPYTEEYYNDKPDSSLAERISVTAPQVKSGIDAVLARGGAISGRITAADTGLGLSGVNVVMLDTSGSGIVSIDTDASGYYTMTSTLPSGTYRVLFLPRESGPACAYTRQYYNSQRTLEASDPVLVLAPDTTPNINATLQRGSTISGRVTAAGSGAGLGNVYVVIYDSSGEQIASTDTDLSGHYLIEPALPSGSYRVGFRYQPSPYLEQYYQNKPTLLASDPITLIAPNDKTGIDTVLTKGGAISGTLTDAATGKPVNTGIVVYNQSGATVAFGSTDASGKYTISPLPSGSYRVLFSSISEELDVAQTSSGGEARAAAQQPPNPEHYADQYYNNKFTLAAADPVVVSAPATTSNINGALARGSTISGRVTAAGSNTPLSKVDVQVYDSQGTLVTGAFTKADGTYTTAGGLPSGAYRLLFSPRNAPSYTGEYYNDKPNLASATPVSVRAPTNVTGINAVLAKGGRITGTVTAAGTIIGLPRVAIEVYDNGGNLVVTGETTSSGGYITPALPSGTYRVRFVPYSQYSAKYYKDKPTLASATMVAVAAPNTTSGINAALIKGSQISGRIQTPDASDPSGVQVLVYDSSGAQVATSEANELGIYQVVPALPSGSYRIGFVPLAGSSYAASFYRGKRTLASADAITLTAPTPRGGINDTLLRWATVHLPLVRR